MEGWELVTFIPRSIDTGASFVGITTEEDWVFMRPETILIKFVKQKVNFSIQISDNWEILLFP
jgi:hypothetical protein